MHSATLFVHRKALKVIVFGVVYLKNWEYSQVHYQRKHCRTTAVKALPPHLFLFLIFFISQFQCTLCLSRSHLHLRDTGHPPDKLYLGFHHASVEILTNYLMARFGTEIFLGCPFQNVQDLLLTLVSPSRSFNAIKLSFIKHDIIIFLFLYNNSER